MSTADQICERLLLAEHGGLGWLRRAYALYCDGLANGRTRAHRRADPLAEPYGNPDLYVTENGACYDDPRAADGAVPWQFFHHAILEGLREQFADFLAFERDKIAVTVGFVELRAKIHRMDLRTCRRRYERPAL